MTASEKRRAQAAKEAMAKHLKSERPNKHTDRVAWNAHFELDIELVYGAYSYDREPLLENAPGIDYGARDITELNVTIASRTKELMHAEGELAALALENLRYGDFEKEWNELRLDKKKELALEGLYRGACNCEGEYNLINSYVSFNIHRDVALICFWKLKRMMEHDSTGNRRVQEVFLFRHPYVDHQYRFTDAAPDVVKAFLYSAQIYRTFCIVETLRGIINACHGLPMVLNLSVVTAMPVRHGEEAEARKAAERQALEEDKKSVRPVDQSQCEEMGAMSYTACNTCFVKTGRKHLKRCGQCQIVWYCSPQCQKKDWPEHKKACGKKTFARPQLAPAAPDEFIGCPVAIPSFVRTPALWRQIWYLSKPDSQYSDYHFDSQPGRTDSLAIQYPPGARLIFLVARRRAMASGSLPAIHKMLAILEFEEDLGVRDFTHARYRRQFEKEYRIKITPESIRQAAGEFAPPTAKELEEEEEFLRRRWASVANHPKRALYERLFPPIL
ncbi:hypothetical protein B0H12DRAFT_1230731 [Mycena haematopus]|nr:hypothetical protein B0H12DRAFT_1230731 [Mycena haematopus]